MMLYLTGADASLTKTGGDSPQSDVNKSLGGYVSSSQVPNGAINVLFDLISSYTLEKKPVETIGLALINKFDKKVKDVELKIVANEDNIAEFKIAAVSVSNDLAMEHISNRYEQPINAEFYDASFYRASVDVKIDRPATAGEEIVFYPMNVVVEVKESGLEGTWNAIFESFDKDDTYLAKRLTDDTFRIERRDEEVVSEPLACSFISTEHSSFTFISELINKKNNAVLISEELQPDECIGIWIQRTIKKKGNISNEELLNMYKNKIISDTTEEVELIINYNLEENP